MHWFARSSIVCDNVSVRAHPESACAHGSPYAERSVRSLVSSNASAPVQMPLPIQLAQEGSPDRQPNSALFPVVQAPPTRRRGGIFGRQILPPRPAAGYPQNPFQHAATIGAGTTSALALAQPRQQGRGLSSLPVGQHRTASWHLRFLLPPYRAMTTTKPSTSLDPESGYETAANKAWQEMSIPQRSVAKLTWAHAWRLPARELRSSAMFDQSKRRGKNKLSQGATRIESLFWTDSIHNWENSAILRSVS